MILQNISRSSNQRLRLFRSLSTCSELSLRESVKQRPIRKLLIANRGEIACRIIKTARKLGIETVSVFSDADRKAMHVALADQAFHIGPAPAIESYLVKDKILEIAKRSNADAIHPGYGFLSENFEFATICGNENIKFVGPKPDSIKSMGIKSLSKSIMIDANVPVIPGFHNDSVQDENVLLEEARKIGFPVMIKAVRGGGGKGMRIALSEAEFISQLESAKREAMKSFGDDIVLLEKFVKKPRHIEVQVFGDQHGNCVHLFERDCSSQRRHQKVIEEAPAPHITHETRHEIGNAAVRAAKAVDYEGAGTVEFIYDTTEHKFYFMEMNTRLQVEHPVTELITGLDLVEWQLRVASGEQLPQSQAAFQHPRGHAFEARIYAEDADNNFMPCTGKIEAMKLPVKQDSSDIVRIETGVREGDEVSVYYDPMIAKLVVWSNDRKSALMKLRQCLAEYKIAGLKTNVDYLIRLANHPKTVEGTLYTDFIDECGAEELKQVRCEDPREKALFKAMAALTLMKRDVQNLRERQTFASEDVHSPFSHNELQLTTVSGVNGSEITLKLRDGESSKVSITYTGDSRFKISADKHDFDIVVNSFDLTSGLFDVNISHDNVLERRKFQALPHGEKSASVFTKDYGVYTFDCELPAFLEKDSSSSGDNIFDGKSIVSPMPAVVEKIAVKEGDSVKNGDTIAILTAMKMEMVIKATFDSDSDTRVVQSIHTKPGASIAKGAKLVQFVDK